MVTNIKATLLFDTGRRVKKADLDELLDGFIDLLKRKFPSYSGSYITITPVNDHGDPVKRKRRV